MMNLDGHLPKFDHHASCSDHDPELWFTDEMKGNSFRVSPDGRMARTICKLCPAFDECMDYSMQYKGLFGIWAGLNHVERLRLQRSLGMRDLQDFKHTYEGPIVAKIVYEEKDIYE